MNMVLSLLTAVAVGPSLLDIGSSDCKDFKEPNKMCFILSKQFKRFL